MKGFLRKRNRNRITHLFTILVIISLLNVVSITAQTTKQDSLLNELNRLPDDSNKVKKMGELTRSFMTQSRDYKKMEEITWKMLALSQKLGYEKGIASAYCSLGICYGYKGNKVLAINAFMNSLRWAKKHNYKNGEARVYNNLGILMLNEGNYDASFDYHLKSLKISDELHDTIGIVTSYWLLETFFLPKK